MDSSGREGPRGLWSRCKFDLFEGTEAPKQADVVILGQGPGALAAAITLRRGGVDVVVVTLGEVSLTAGRLGAGILTLGIEDPPHQLTQSLGGLGEGIFHDGAWAFRRARAWLDELKVAIHSEGALRAAANPREGELLRASLELMTTAGLEARWVEGEEAQVLAGLGAPRGGSMTWEGGVLLGGGCLFSPGELHDGLLRVALEEGVIFIDGGPEPRLLEGERGEGVLCQVGAVRGEVVIVAAGPKTGKVTADYEPYFNVARLQGICAGRGDDGGGVGGQPKVMGFTANGGFEWGRPLGESAYCLGGYRYMDVELSMAPAQDQASAWDNPRIRGRQEAVLDAAWPGHPLIDGAIAREITLGCDNLPIVGPHPGEGRRHLILGLGGHDISLGIGAGEAVARGILGRGEGRFGGLSLRRML